MVYGLRDNLSRRSLIVRGEKKENGEKWEAEREIDSKRINIDSDD